MSDKMAEAVKNLKWVNPTYKLWLRPIRDISSIKHGVVIFKDRIYPVMAVAVCSNGNAYKISLSGENHFGDMYIALADFECKVFDTLNAAKAWLPQVEHDALQSRRRINLDD